jgi:hypothetical protein
MGLIGRVQRLLRISLIKGYRQPCSSILSSLLLLAKLLFYSLKNVYLASKDFSQTIFLAKFHPLR